MIFQTIYNFCLYAKDLETKESLINELKSELKEECNNILDNRARDLGSYNKD